MRFAPSFDGLYTFFVPVPIVFITDYDALREAFVEKGERVFFDKIAQYGSSSFNITYTPVRETIEHVEMRRRWSVLRALIVIGMAAACSCCCWHDLISPQQSIARCYLLLWPRFCFGQEIHSLPLQELTCRVCLLVCLSSKKQQF